MRPILYLEWKKEENLNFSLLLSFLHRQKQSFDIVEDYNLRSYP